MKKIINLKLVNTFGIRSEKEFQKTNQTEFRVERKDDKLYFTWKRYGNLFNSLIE